MMIVLDAYRRYKGRVLKKIIEDAVKSARLASSQTRNSRTTAGDNGGASQRDGKTYAYDELVSMVKGSQYANLYGVVERLFFEHQDASEIQRYIFEMDARAKSPLSDREREQLVGEKRQKFRSALTEEDSRMFDGAKEVLKDLSRTHNLLIISNTNEETIRRVLIKAGISDLFFEVFGKGEQDRALSGGKPGKRHLLERCVKTLGVPKERLVYVGDNNGDYEATTSAGIDFIEARLLSEKLRKSIKYETLIKCRQTRERPSDSKNAEFVFEMWDRPGSESGSSRRPKSFCEVLAEVESAKARRYPYPSE